MRVAQVVASYHPRLGGVETHVRRIAEGCAAAGDEVTVLTHQTGGLPPVGSIGSVRVLRFPLTVRMTHYPVSLSLFGYLRERAADFDVVHAHSYHTLVGQAAAHSRLPFVFTPHYHGTGHTRLRALLHQVYRPVGGRLFAAADAVICVSAAERDLVTGDFPAAADKVRVIPNGTDPRQWLAGGPAAGPAGGPADSKQVVLTVGRLERYKNVDLTIRACRVLGERVTLVIAGDGEDRPRLEQLAGPGGSVRFAGRVSDAELDELLATATVVTSASDHEAFGMIVADGLAAGARVVASAIPAHLEVGRLAGTDPPITYVDPRDTREFTAALATALALGRVSDGHVHLPSWTRVAHQTRELYAWVSGSRSRRARRGEPA